MKKKYVNEFRAGDSVDEIFVLQDKSMGHKKDGNNYLNVTLADKTGNVKGVMWDNVDQITAAQLTSGDFVHVQGRLNEYRGGLQAVVKHLTACPADSVDYSDFIPRTRHNTESMFERLVGLTESMETEYLKELFSGFWNDLEFVEKFKTAPAAKHMHHAYLGGLLEHTLSMAVLVERIAGHYSGVDMDLLLAGVVLHDIGKIKEFEYRYRIEYTDEGRLLSHIVIGLQMLDEKIREVPHFPEDRAKLLKHLIVSHHGSREFGSPELPKTIEAFLLNYIDEIDSKVNGIREFISSEDPNETWTSYHRVLGRHFYIEKDKGNYAE
jgi:3'-5' exoribonuclease